MDARAVGSSSTGSEEVVAGESLSSVIEAMLRDLFSSTMTLINEEDAVLLYRCTRLAESSPLLLECCDVRRTAIEDGLAKGINSIFRGAQRKLNEIHETAIEAARTGGHNTHAGHASALEAKLEQVRLAAKVQAEHQAVEREVAVREALKVKDAEVEAKLKEEWAAMAEELSEARLLAELSAADVRGRAQSEVEAAQRRLTEREKEIDRLEGNSRRTRRRSLRSRFSSQHGRC